MAPKSEIRRDTKASSRASGSSGSSSSGSAAGATSGLGDVDRLHAHPQPRAEHVRQHARRAARGWVLVGERLLERSAEPNASCSTPSSSATGRARSSAAASDGRTSRTCGTTSLCQRRGQLRAVEVVDRGRARRAAARRRGRRLGAAAAPRRRARPRGAAGSGGCGGASSGGSSAGALGRRRGRRAAAAGDGRLRRGGRRLRDERLRRRLGQRGRGGRDRDRGRRRRRRLQRVDAAQQGVERALAGRARQAHQQELQRQARVAALAQLALHRHEPVGEARPACGRRRPRPGAPARRGRRRSPAPWRGGSPSWRVRNTRRTCSVRSPSSWPRSWPPSTSSSTSTSRPAASRAATRSASRVSVAASTTPRIAPASASVDPAVARGRELVEHGDGVAERAAAGARDQVERGVLDLDALALRDPAQHGVELVQAGAREGEGLAAALDRVQQPVRLRRAEDEDDVRRRLLERLQQRVRGVGGQRVRLVEDVDLVAALDGLHGDALADLAHVVDAAVATPRRARSRRARWRRGSRRRRRSGGTAWSSARRTTGSSATSRGSSRATSCPCRAGRRTGTRGARGRPRSRCRACARRGRCPTTSDRSCGRYLR